MRKFIFIIMTLAIVGGIGFGGYLIFSDKALVRTPVLVSKSPVITYVIGDCYYRETQGMEWKLAIVGTKLGDTYQVKTKPSSIMDIRFHDDTAIRVSEDSLISIKKLNIKRLDLHVDKGSIFGKFERLYKSHSIKLSTPTTVAAIRGTDIALEVTDIVPDKKKRKKKKDDEDETPLKTSTVYTVSGIMEVMRPDDKNVAVLLSNQHKVSVNENEPPSNPEKMTEEEVGKIQSILNTLHFEEVLLITNKVYFNVGSADILKKSYPELDKIATVLNKRSETIRIEGHTDSDGEAHLNQKLSTSRADSIKNYLIKKGVDKERLSIAGFGESKPIVSNRTKLGKAQNRRVEFIIVEDD